MSYFLLVIDDNTLSYQTTTNEQNNDTKKPRITLMFPPLQVTND